jgi:hypothetical protein
MDNLPDELKEMIVSYLDPKSKANLSLSSRSMRQLIPNKLDQVKELLQNELPDVVTYNDFTQLIENMYRLFYPNQKLKFKFDWEKMDMNQGYVALNVYVKTKFREWTCTQRYSIISSGYTRQGIFFDYQPPWLEEAVQGTTFFDIMKELVQDEEPDLYDS